MNMKMVSCLFAVVLSASFAQSAKAGTVSDNFNDGNADGWLSAPESSTNSLGNWRVVNGIVVEDAGRDHYKFLLDDYPLSVQSVGAKVLFHDNGYAGITVWHLDENNWVDVLIYPDANILRVIESEGTAGRYDYFDYPLTGIFTRSVWYTMRIDANNLTGELVIYLDNQYLLTHTATTSHKTGLSGFNSGNGGGSFDDFQVSWTDVVEPLINKDQCKDGGWKVLNNHTFKNQGQCVSSVVSKKP
jgi:hypothetical protein